MQNDSVTLLRLAKRYRYLEREGMLPLPAKDGITVVVELRHAQWAAEALRLLLLHSQPRIKVVAVSMEAAFPLAAVTEAFGDERALRFIPFERGFGLNAALAAAETSYVLLLEDRVMVHPGWLDALLWPLIDDPGVALAAPLSAAERPQEGGRYHFGSDRELSVYAAGLRSADGDDWSYAEALGGPCLLFRRELFGRVGGLDLSLAARSLILTDWSLRARQLGFSLALCRSAYVHVLHTLQELETAAGLDEGRRAYLAKWGLPDTRPAGLFPPLPAELSSLPLQPFVPLGPVPGSVFTAAAVVFFDEQWSDEAARVRQQQLRAELGGGRIRWVWVRNSRGAGVCGPEAPGRDAYNERVAPLGSYGDEGESPAVQDLVRDVAIFVRGEPPWLHALEQIASLYASETVVYLSPEERYPRGYIQQLAEALQRSGMDIVVHLPAEAAANEPPPAPGLTRWSVPLGRIAHRRGIAPGRIGPAEPGRGLALFPHAAWTVGYVRESSASGEGGV
ncbi:hypothetical protein [Paenibacillus sp. NFR01]|uniref:hypothetical protein n=1 Tax=Paenibacillus sp. NFR01 TaxID=1566279 RepID=UPI0008B4C7EA|nr:hypothetical protein [Paenibacillus sp. NFR01]SEU20253.1 hypothetical protein SAMN03159358_3966 [Paenibacillus sp. NFR01]